MKVTILMSANGAVVHFRSDTTEEHRLIAKAMIDAKKKEHDGSYALSKFLLDLTEGRLFEFAVDA